MFQCTFRYQRGRLKKLNTRTGFPYKLLNISGENVIYRIQSTENSTKKLYIPAKHREAQ